MASDMALTDLPLEDLERYRPERTEPADFDAFWAETIASSRSVAVDPTFTLVDSPLRTIDVFDLTFSGFMGQPIRGWFLVPRHRETPLPAVVEFIGYGGGRGFPFDWLTWASAGYAHLVMDTRGQGSAWNPGATPDVHVGSGPHYPGFLTSGITDPADFYYRRLITDAVRAIDTCAAHPLIDPNRLVACGVSQGGGIALAVSGLTDQLRASLIDVPFLCHYRRAVDVTSALPYAELTSYLATHRDHADSVFRTLSYFDGLNFASRATSPALFSAGLMDPVCPPSTIFAACNHYRGPHEMRAWPFNGHDAAGSHHQVERFAFLARQGVAP